MLDWKRKYETFVEKQRQAGSSSSSSKDTGGQDGKRGNAKQLDISLERNLREVQVRLGDNTDLTVRNLHYGKREAALLYYSSLTDQKQIQEGIVRALMSAEGGREAGSGDDVLAAICEETVYINVGARSADWSALLEWMTKGHALLLLDGYAEAQTFDTRKIEKRGIEQPQTEQVIRGAREGFIEALETNLSLIRYRLQSASLKIETGDIGARTKSKVAVCYMDGIANPDLIGEVMRRLAKINIDGIIDTGYIEQFIEDQPLSPFPQIQNTERPDKTVAALLEGRVAILVDGSSFALIVPALFDQFFQTIDDYSERFLIASLLRFVRLAALMFSIFFPSLYVSVISYNPENDADGFCGRGRRRTGRSSFSRHAGSTHYGGFHGNSARSDDPAAADDRGRLVDRRRTRRRPSRRLGRLSKPDYGRHRRPDHDRVIRYTGL